MKATVHIHLLGTPEIRINQSPVTFPFRKAEALIYYLAVRKLASRSELSSLLWGECSEAAALKNLRHTLYICKKVCSAELILSPSKRNLLLNPSFSYEIDYDSFFRSTDPSLYGGEFLQNFYLRGAPEFESWSDQERTSVRNRYHRLLSEAMRTTPVHQVEKIEVFFARCREIDPFDEPVYCRMLQVYLNSRLYHKGIRLYKELEKTLDQELQISPGAEARSLYRQLLLSSSSRPVDGPELSARLPDGGNASDGSFAHSSSAYGFSAAGSSAAVSSEDVLCGDATSADVSYGDAAAAAVSQNAAAVLSVPDLMDRIRALEEYSFRRLTLYPAAYLYRLKARRYPLHPLPENPAALSRDQAYLSGEIAAVREALLHAFRFSRMAIPYPEAEARILLAEARLSLMQDAAVSGQEILSYLLTSQEYALADPVFRICCLCLRSLFCACAQELAQMKDLLLEAEALCETHHVQLMLCAVRRLLALGAFMAGDEACASEYLQRASGMAESSFLFSGEMIPNPAVLSLLLARMLPGQKEAQKKAARLLSGTP